MPTSANARAKNAKILIFLVTEDWFFASHFLRRALAAKAAGWHVILIANSGSATSKLRDAGIEVIPTSFNRRRINPLAELCFSIRLARVYRKLNPTLVHHIAIKPIIVGNFAARLARVPAVVNAPVGLGFIFSSTRPLARILKPVIRVALRLALASSNTLAIFENPDDIEDLVNQNVLRREVAVLIRGAGVNTSEFSPAPEPAQPVRVVLIARMIREKGIGEFMEAARILHARGACAEFVLAGAPDPGNPDTVSEAELRRWEASGLVSWLGPQTDVAALLRASHIACQPSSYREGLPKAVLEAMACAKPVVATDIPGSREAVVHGETGLLVPPRNPAALADALEKLINSHALRTRMGNAGRRRVEEHFTDSIICQQTVFVYEKLMNRIAP